MAHGDQSATPRLITRPNTGNGCRAETAIVDGWDISTMSRLTTLEGDFLRTRMARRQADHDHGASSPEHRTDDKSSSIDHPSRPTVGPAPDVQIVREELLIRAEDLFRHGLGEPSRPTASEWRPKISTGFCMEMRGPKRGLWNNFKCDEGGDILDFFAVYFCGLTRARDDFSRVLREAAAWAGISADAPPDPAAAASRRATREAKEKQADEARAREKAATVQRVIAHAQPLAGSPAARYLAGRGISQFPLEGAAFVPTLPRGTGVSRPNYPSLTTWCVDDEGNISGGQRILLNPEGASANVKVRKASFGTTKGCPARFPARDVGGPIYVAEGTETALTIWQATGAETWAVIGVSNWASAPLPKGRQIILCPDRDKPTSEAGNLFWKAVATHHEAGRNIWIAEAPEPEGSTRDLNDTLQEAGPEAVLSALQAARRFESAPEAVPFYPAPMGDRADQIAAHDRAVREWGARSFHLTDARRDLRRKISALPEDMDGEERRRVHRDITAEIAERFRLPSPPSLDGPLGEWVMLTGAQGVGKTASAVGRWIEGRAVRGVLHDAVGLVTLCLFPTHAKAAEARRDFESVGEAFLFRNAPASIHLKGRAHLQPDGSTMCRIPEAAKAVAASGVSVSRSLCTACPYNNDCPYQQQARKLRDHAKAPPGVIIFAVQATAQRPLPGSVVPDLVFYDEAACDPVEVFDLPLGRLETLIEDVQGRSDLPASDDALQAIEGAFEAVLTAARSEPRAIGEHLRVLGQTPASLRAAEAAARERQEIVTTEMVSHAFPNSSDRSACVAETQIAAALKEGETLAGFGQAVALLDVLAAELEHERPAPVAVTVERDRSQMRVLRVRRLKRPDGIPETAALLHADGTGDHMLAKAFFGRDLHLAHHPVERLAHVTYLTGHSFSKTALTGALVKARNARTSGCDGKGKKSRVTKEFEDLVECVREVVGRYPGCALVTYKDALTPQALNLGSLDCQTGHFNGIRGLNSMEDCQTIVVAGRILPPMDAVEDRGRAFAAALGRPFTSLCEPGKKSPRWPSEERGLRMRDGTGHLVKVKVHPDPTADALLRQMRDAEIAQAVDRLRLIHTERVKRVILMGDSLPDITVDRVIGRENYRDGGSKPERALLAGRRLLPLSARQAALALPELWNSPSSAQEELNRIRKLFGYANRRFICSLEHISEAHLVKYRTCPNETNKDPKKYEALASGPADEIRERVEAAFGPLDLFDIVETYRPTAAERPVPGLLANPDTEKVSRKKLTSSGENMAYSATSAPERNVPQATMRRAAVRINATLRLGSPKDEPLNPHPPLTERTSRDEPTFSVYLGTSARAHATSTIAQLHPIDGGEPVHRRVQKVFPRPSVIKQGIKAKELKAIAESLWDRSSPKRAGTKNHKHHRKYTAMMVAVALSISSSRRATLSERN